MRNKLLRTCAVAIGGAGLALGVTSTSALAATQTSLHVALQPTGQTIGRIWTDGGGGQHARDVYDTDQMVEGGTVVGTLAWNINFNLWPNRDYASEVWCSFQMNLDTLGQYDGSCEGTLMAGQLIAHGADGSTLSGTYAVAPGGVLGHGPYVLDFTVDQRGS